MNQPQREALIDLLNVAIFSDSHLSLKEDEALQAALETVGWENTRPREIFILTSLSRARRASDTDAGITDFLTARTSEFTDSDSQNAALALLEKVFAGDGIAPAEANFLARIRSAFESM